MFVWTCHFVLSGSKRKLNFKTLSRFMNDQTGGDIDVTPQDVEVCASVCAHHLIISGVTGSINSIVCF